MKWIGKHIWDFISLFRNKVGINTDSIDPVRQLHVKDTTDPPIRVEGIQSSTKKTIIVKDSNDDLYHHDTSGFTLTADSGVDQVIQLGDELTIAGGDTIVTGVGNTDTVTVNHDEVARTNDSSSASPLHGDAFTVIDSLTTSGTGHVTNVNTKTVNLPADINTMGSGFVLEDHSGDEVTITENKEVKFIAAGGMTIDWTDTDNGTDGDPYDLTFTSADTNTTYSAGTLLDLATTTFNVDLSEAAAAVMAAGDGIIFTDADDGNAAKQETLQDLLDTIAGTVGTTGLDRSGATLVVSSLAPAGVTGSDNQVLTDTGSGTINSEANLTFDGSTLSIEADANTTANALFIDANALTTGSAIKLDIDDALTTGAIEKSLISVDYDKNGDTASGQVNSVIGMNVDLKDNADDNLGVVGMEGVRVVIDSTDADGSVSQVGYRAKLTDGDVATTIGYLSDIEDGGMDFKATSSANIADFCVIATTTNGATTISTTDADAALANLDLTVDGKITMTPASIAGDAFHLDADGAAGSIVNIDAGILDIDSTGITTLNAGSVVRITAGTTSSFTSGQGTTITSGALTKFLATGGVEIENGASSGGSALLIDNNDVGEIALEINAVNMTANIVDITSTTLTAGHALDINITNAGGTGDHNNTIAKIDTLKQGITGSGNSNKTLGLHINMADEATNNAASDVWLKGIQVDIDLASGQGREEAMGLILNVAADGNGDLAKTHGILTKVMDGAADIKMQSAADVRDYCTIGTTANGATSITTIDGTAADADFLIQADGDIRLMSAAKLTRSHGAVGGAGIPMGIHHYNFAGYAEGIGANWMYPDPWSDNKSPFEIVNDWGDSDIDSGSPGWDATGSNGLAQWFRCGRYVVGRDCTTVGWNGWTTCSVDETDEQGIAIIRVRPAAGGGAIDPASSTDLELIREWIFDGDNSNHKPEYVGADADGEQFAIDLNKGDILIPMAKATAGEALYFQVNLEVQWRDV